MCIAIETEAKRPALRLISTQGGAKVDTLAAPMRTDLHRVIAASQTHAPEPDDELSLGEAMAIDLVAFLLFLSTCMLVGWGWQEYQNLDLHGLMKALGSIAPVL